MTWLHAAVIAAVTCGAYAGSFDGAFVSDDHVSVVRNPVIRSFDLGPILTTFDDANYIPVKVLSVAVDYRLWGLEPAGYHATNLLIHVACAWLVYAILVRLGLARGAACLAALVWAVHPLQVESVAWISERKNVLSGLFFFAAFLVYLGFSARGGAGRYLLMLALYALALLSKMNTVVLLAIILAYEVTYQRRLRVRDLAATVPMIALGAMVVLYTLAGSGSHGEAWHGGSPLVTWLSSSVVVFRYVEKLLLPTGLAARYQVPLYDSPLDGPVLASIAGLLALGVAIVWLVARRRREAFWILWFVICLAPMLNIVPFRSLMQDRFMYLPMLGPIALVAFWLDARLRAPGARRIAATAAAVLVGVYTGLTVRQVEAWDSDFALWQGEARTAAFLAADPPYEPPDRHAKREFLQTAVAADPSSPWLQNNLAAMAYSAGRNDEALAGFERAATLVSDHPEVLINLGRAYARAGRAGDALRTLERAALLAPHNVHAHLSLARLHLAEGNAAGARREMEICRHLIPGDLAARAWQAEWAALARLEAARGR